jgi:putative endonuclease
MDKMNKRTKQKGDIGEEVAFRYLKDRKYKILERNYRNRIGEIDIVAQRKGIIVFIEVKSQYVEEANSWFHPERNVHERKQDKLIRLGESFLLEKKYPDSTNWQIDVIGVALNFSQRRAQIRHLKNAILLEY